MKYVTYTSTNQPGVLGKIALAVSTVALAGVALMFSAVLLSGILIVGTIAGAWLWWKTREVRRQMRQMQEAMQNAQARSTTTAGETFQAEAFDGEVFEGEVISVERSDSDIKR